jgi:hypothetical protein
MKVCELHSLLEQAIRDGHETRDVKVMEVHGGVPFLRDVVVANDANEEDDGPVFLIFPSDEEQAPDWMLNG